MCFAENKILAIVTMYLLVNGVCANDFQKIAD